MSGGRFQLLSGRAYLQVFVDAETGEVHERMAHRSPAQLFHGTAAYMRIGLHGTFSLSDALALGGEPYYPTDYVELRHADGQGGLHLKVAEEAVGFGSRKAGEQFRTKCKNLLAAEPLQGLTMDWTGVPMISSSFADEAVGRLFRELGPLESGARIRHENMEQIVRQLVERAIIQRMRQ